MGKGIQESGQKSEDRTPNPELKTLNSERRTESAHLDQQFAGCLSSFQIVIGLSDTCHRVDALDS
jgi:hypothetical protein